MPQVVVPRSAAELQILMEDLSDPKACAAKLARIQSGAGSSALPVPSLEVVRAWEFYLGIHGTFPIVMSSVSPLAWAAAEALGHTGSAEQLPVPYNSRSQRVGLPSFMGGAKPAQLRVRDLRFMLY